MMIVQCNKFHCRFHSDKEKCRHGVVHELEASCMSNHPRCDEHPSAECMEV